MKENKLGDMGLIQHHKQNVGPAIVLTYTDQDSLEWCYQS